MSTGWKRSLACWAVLGRMLALRASLPLLTRLLPLEQLVRLLAHPRAATDVRAQGLAVRVARRLWRGSNGPCLQRSLALYTALGRAGAQPQLRCGIARDDNGVVGHAWVVAHGEALLEDGDPDAIYATIVGFDEAGRRTQAPPREL